MKIFLILVFLFIISSFRAQEVFISCVSNEKPEPNVHVFHGSELVSISNGFGEVTLPPRFIGENLCFHKVGFKDSCIVLEGSTVHLNLKKELRVIELPEMTISAKKYPGHFRYFSSLAEKHSQVINNLEGDFKFLYERKERFYDNEIKDSMVLVFQMDILIRLKRGKREIYYNQPVYSVYESHQKFVDRKVNHLNYASVLSLNHLLRLDLLDTKAIIGKEKLFYIEKCASTFPMFKFYNKDTSDYEFMKMCSFDRIGYLTNLEIIGNSKEDLDKNITLTREYDHWLVNFEAQNDFYLNSAASSTGYVFSYKGKLKRTLISQILVRSEVDSENEVSWKEFKNLDKCFAKSNFSRSLQPFQFEF